MEQTAPPKTFLHNGETFPCDPQGRPMLPFTRLAVTGRVRKNFGEMTGLEESIKSKWYIHAVAVADNPDTEGKYPVLDGGRRHRTAMNLFATLRDQKYLMVPIVFFSDLSELQRKEIELETTLQRKSFEQTELCELTLQIHRLKTQIHGEASRGSTEGWSQIKTAELTGTSKGMVSKQIKLGEIMERDPKMKKIIKERKMPIDVALKFVEQIELARKQKAQVDAGTLSLNHAIVQGDCCELIKTQADASVDLVVTDPPFGNETIADQEGKSRGTEGPQSYTSTLEKTDNLSTEAVLLLFDTLAGELARVLKPGAHFYIFYSQAARHGLGERLERAGLVVQGPDLIWDKEKNQNAFSGYNYMSTYEPIIFGYKPNADGSRRRLAEAHKNILRVAPISREVKIHAFHKPRDLLAILIRQSSHAGQLVLDPFCGSGEVVKTAQILSRSGLGYEKSERNFHSAQKYLSEKE